MKVLLDENLDQRLRGSLGAHEVFTAIYKGWAGLKNGHLLNASEADGIEVFVTGDQTLSFEQNLQVRSLAIVVLSTVEWRMLQKHLQKIIVAIHNATPGTFQSVDCGTFSRKKRQT